MNGVLSSNLRRILGIVGAGVRLGSFNTYLKTPFASRLYALCYEYSSLHDGPPETQASYRPGSRIGRPKRLRAVRILLRPAQDASGCGQRVLHRKPHIMANPRAPGGAAQRADR